MEALILSCSTGGGHNAAAYAVQEAFRLRGHNAVVLDPYVLAGKDLDKKVAAGYVKIVQKVPGLFGVIYKLGEAYRKLPVPSPVYAVNIAMRKRMQEYLSKHHYDIIFTTHIYPGEILLALKNKGVNIPPTVFIATDYVCVPFTEEIGCDYFITPSKELSDDFIRHGLPEDRLVPAGIPVKSIFKQDITRDEALAELGLDSRYRYLLISGGSIGCGMLNKTIDVLGDYFESHTDCKLIAICGNNKKLLEKLNEKYADDERIILIASTDKMLYYMKAADVFLSKPGGLSSTEAAVCGTRLIHITPIPGCENKNMSFFERNGMSVAVGKDLSELPRAIEKIVDPSFSEEIRDNQRRIINPNAAEDICKFAENLIERW